MALSSKELETLLPGEARQRLRAYSDALLAEMGPNDITSQEDPREHFLSRFGEPQVYGLDPSSFLYGAFLSERETYFRPQARVKALRIMSQYPDYNYAYC